MMEERILWQDIPIDCLGQAETLREKITGWLEGPGKSHHIVTLNARMLMAALAKPELGQVIRQADLVLIDGCGIEFALKKQGYTNPVRMAGIDLVRNLLDWGSTRELPVFFYGGSVEMAKRLRERASAVWPGLIIRGIWDGYGIELDRQQVKQEILRWRPRLLLAGLGSPAQEMFLAETLPALEGAVGIGVGGALEVLAGLKAEAPSWVRRRGGEWLFRMVQEPRKLCGLPDLVRFWLRFLR